MKRTAELCACWALVWVLSGCMGVEPTAGESVSEEVQEVINGTPWPDGLNAADGRFVTVQKPNGGRCSGTLLRRNVVLTAAHCLKDGDVLIDPNDITVTDQARTTTVRATGYAAQGQWEGAVVLLSRDLTLGGGSHLGGFTQITSFAFTRDSLVGQQLWCPGYGINAATKAQCQAGFSGTGSGTLRGHWNVPFVSGSGDGAPTFSDHVRLSYGDNGSGQNRSRGDSGSSCIRTNRAGNAWEAVDVLGWYTDGATCIDYSGTGDWGASSLDAIAAVGFANFVRDQMRAWAPNTLDTFSTNTLGNYTVVDPISPSGGSSAWAWTGSFLRQSSNTYEFIGDVMDGSKLLLTASPIGEADVSVRLRSSDDDAAGIVFRYHDPTHYYQLTIDEQRSRMQFAKRAGSSFTVIKNIPFTIDWGTWHTIRVTARGSGFFSFTVDGVQPAGGFATDPDDDYMDGHAGVISAGMDPLEVDNFTITNNF